MTTNMLQDNTWMISLVFWPNINVLIAILRATVNELERNRGTSSDGMALA